MDDCVETKEQALANVKLYLERLPSAGDGLVLIGRIVEYVRKKVLTWDEIGISPDQLSDYAWTMILEKRKYFHAKEMEAQRNYLKIRDFLSGEARTQS